MKVIDLDAVSITYAAAKKWEMEIRKRLPDIQHLGLENLTDEKFRILDDGSAEIFATIGEIEIKIPIQKHEWVMAGN